MHYNAHLLNSYECYKYKANSFILFKLQDIHLIYTKYHSDTSLPSMLPFTISIHSINPGRSFCKLETK